ncbi:hypothetical protein LTR62_003764 [Meristemomyces frigidus]|uniref:Thioredoxin n=1 Tax=Meristemomyces frigidus TaxID=1508187 RepID=A0AAN7TIA8_9PEZI|nr:hypothetical protein LTR62_003764 [Meristemomyces frigidus]
MSQIVNVTSAQHFSSLLNTSRIVVTDFWAPWCGPCRAIAPVYEQLSTQLSRSNAITFAKVNTDEQKDISQTYNVSALPTFIIFKAGREVKRIKGADPKGLNEAVKMVAQEAGKADEGGGGSGSGAGEASGSGSSSGGLWTGAPAPRGYVDITDAVDALGLDFLNLDDSTGDKRTLFDTRKPTSLGAGKAKEKESSKKDWVESDTDEQLMLFIPFQSTVKLHTIHVTSFPPQDSDDEQVSRPKTIKLYTNRSTVIGFDEADDMPCTQELAIKDSDWDAKTGTAKMELRFVKFQNISSLVIFIVNGAEESEKTRVDRLRFFGETGEKRAMGKLEKVGDEQGE